LEIGFMTSWLARERPILDGTSAAPKVMGIVNVTPDSFSDGGRFGTFDEALRHARELIEQGADLLDIGGESTRPGSEPVSVVEELRRVLPLIEALRAEIDVPISIDTTKAEVARRALEAGASIVNDVTGLTGDPGMLPLAAETGAGVVLMHMAGTPRTMQLDPRYEDVVTEVHDALAERIEVAEAAGIPRERIAIDPGIGFGKTFDHNRELLRNLGRFGNLGCAVLIGTSRKGFLGTITGRPVDQRQTASVVSSLFATTRGAGIVRVHDVGAMVDAIKVWSALGDWEDT
jgi:dihydropteroate synthase